MFELFPFGIRSSIFPTLWSPPFTSPVSLKPSLVRVLRWPEAVAHAGLVAGLGLRVDASLWLSKLGPKGSRLAARLSWIEKRITGDEHAEERKTEV